MLSDLSSVEILLLVLGATGIGFSKAGFPGISMLHVIVYAIVFEPLASTGVLLPMLVFGDVCAIVLFGQQAN